MKNIVLSIAATTAMMGSFAQTGHWCATDAHNEAIHAANPGMATAMHEHLVRVTSGAYASDEREDETCIIPVVVHILHNNGPGNISIEQVQSGIDMLNEDFNRENPDAPETRNTTDAPFLDEASDMGIRFELAKIDPDGNCTNGIQRRYVGASSFEGSNDSKHYSSGGLDAWDRNYYFNIWIVNAIESFGDGTTLGYAEFPYGGGSSNYGVIIRNDAYGRVGTASGDRTLSHEAGHCFGLLHTFQGGCHSGNCATFGDYCCDTPPVSEAQWSCDETQNTCSVVPTGDLYGFNALDQFENFMSYSPCQNMFSNDQKNIVLSNFESIAFLSNLIDEDHWDETGVGVPAVLCKAQFSSDKSTTCEDGTVQFIDESFANVTSWNWTFEGGTPATSTEENPTVAYAESGEYEVSLTVSDGLTSESVTVDNAILVLSDPGIDLPFVESFETITVPDNERFLVINQDGEETWEVTDEAGYTGNKSVKIDNHGVTNESIDELISGSIDLSGVDEDDDMIFTFKYAYHKRYPSNDEWIRFYISRDCGETWALRKNIHGDELSEEQTGAPYVPESKDEWKEVSITNIFSDYYVSNFRFKIQFENQIGNDIYIDDINMYPASMSSLIQDDQQFEFSVFPNPANKSIRLIYDNEKQENITISIVDMLGKSVMNPMVQNSANTNFDLDISHLVPGLYLVNVTDEQGNTATKRFVKN